MAEPGVSDQEKERLLAEIGVEPSSVMIRRVESAPPPSAAPAPVVPVPVVAPAATPSAAPARAYPAWLEQRHAAAGGVLAIVGAAWTSVALAFGRPGAAVLAALALGAGTAALFRPPPRKSRPKKS